MAALTTKERKRIPASKFAGPDRSYPVEDKSHAANAKARATQAVKAGRMSKGEEAKIDSKANRVLERGHGRESHGRPEHSAKARHGTEKKDMPLHPKTKTAAERGREGNEMNSLPRPREERMHMGSKGYDEKKKGGERVASTAKEHRKDEKPSREHEPKKEARAHEREGMKKAMEEKAEKGHGGEKHHHHHYHHHHGAK